MNPEWIGYAAAILTTAGYVPQAVKAIREKHTKSLSLAMYAMMTAAGALWFAYGLLIQSPSVMLANAITFVLTLIILLIKLRHG